MMPPWWYMAPLCFVDAWCWYIGMVVVLEWCTRILWGCVVQRKVVRPRGYKLLKNQRAGQTKRTRQSKNLCSAGGWIAWRSIHVDLFDGFLPHAWEARLLTKISTNNFLWYSELSGQMRTLNLEQNSLSKFGASLWLSDSVLGMYYFWRHRIYL